MKKIKVMVVDDHAITRDGIKTILKVYDDFHFVGEASNGKEAIDFCSKLRPDVILMDLEMPVMDGVNTINSLKEQYPDIKIIALTSYSGRKMVTDAIKAGATSYVIKNISPDALVKVIKDAYKGRGFFSPEATASMVEEIKENPSQKYDLTKQELNILSYIVKGYSNNKIASELFVSHNTIKFHVSNILSKLGVSTRAEAAVFATKKKIIE